jgi:hypothetical protein
VVSGLLSMKEFSWVYHDNIKKFIVMHHNILTVESVDGRIWLLNLNIDLEIVISLSVDI